MTDFHLQQDLIHQALRTERTLLQRNQSKIDELEAQKLMNQKALAVIDRATQLISQNGIGKIESIVSDGLRLVFDQDLRLVIERKDGARGDSYRLLVQQGEVMGPPIETMGGGVVNVISFLLRVIMIQRFKLSRFMALDESFNNVADELLPRVSDMLRSLCDDHGYTILAVTHQSRLAKRADQVYSVDKGPLLRLLDGVDLETEADGNQVESRDPQAAQGAAAPV